MRNLGNIVGRGWGRLLLLLLLLVGILLVFDDSLLCASLTEYDNCHADFHCYLQHFLFTESVI